MNLGTIYLVCAIAGGTILVLRIVLMVIGIGGHDNLTDANAVDLNHDGIADNSGGAFNFLSLQSIAGFFTLFGLVGIGLLEIGASDVLSLLGAFASGLLTAWATGLIFLSMRRLQSEGTLVIQNAVGQVGTVYLSIPEQGTGVVNVTVQGALRALDAISESGRRIPTGAIVKVTGIAAGKILVVSEQSAERS